MAITRYHHILTPLFMASMLAACGQSEIAGSNYRLVTKTISIDYGKPGAPVALSYTLPDKLLGGQTIEIGIELSTTSTADSLSLSLTANSGLTLLSTSNHSFSVNSAQALLHTANVLLPNADGLYYLNANVLESDTAGNTMMARSFAIPLQIGSSERVMKTHTDLEESNGEKIIEMTAEQR